MTENVPDSREPFAKEHDLGKRPTHEIKLDWPVPGHEVAIDVRTNGAIIKDVVVDGVKILTSTEPESVEQEEEESVGGGGWEVVSQEVNDEGQQPQQRGFPSMLEKVKLPVGSINMAPVGIMKDEEGKDKPGDPQHGKWRYYNHETAYSAGRVVEVRAEDPHSGLGHSMTVEQLDDGVKSTDEIVNLGQEVWDGSDGKHWYLATAETAPNDNPLQGIRLLNPDGTDIVFRGRLEKTRAELVKEGIHLEQSEGEEENGRYITGTLEQFIPFLLNDVTVTLAPEGFGGSIHVFIPGKGIITVEARADTAEGEQPVALWLWHREGTKSFCVEPVTGIYEGPNGEFANDRIAVEPGQTLKMTSSVRREQSLNTKTPEVDEQPQP